MNRISLLILATLAFSPLGCGGEYASTEPPSAYPVRADFLVTSTPTATPTQAPAPGFPPLASLSLPNDLKDTDQKNFAAELASKNIVDCSLIGADERRALEVGLGKYFGTPAQPHIATPSPALDSAIDALKLDPASLARGGQIFRSNCLQCHGLTGNGNGPGAKYLFPMPRDYRQGIFKFVTTEPSPDGTKPHRQNLFDTVWRGLPGSGMNSFAGLRTDEIDDVVSHVIFLAIRGEAEYQVMKMVTKFNMEAEDIEPEIKKQIGKLLTVWNASQNCTITPAPNPYTTPEQQLAAAVAGYAVFNDGKQGACTTCHVKYGRSPVYKYDSWGTVVQPRNLTVDIRRVGNGAEQIYARVYGGIHGSGMPSHAHLLPKPGDVDNKIWQLAYFVRFLAYPDTRAKLQEQVDLGLD